MILSVYPDGKVHRDNMEPTWDQQNPGGPHVDPMNLAIWVNASQMTNWLKPSPVLPLISRICLSHLIVQDILWEKETSYPVCDQYKLYNVHIFIVSANCVPANIICRIDWVSILPEEKINSFLNNHTVLLERQNRYYRPNVCNWIESLKWQSFTRHKICPNGQHGHQPININVECYLLLIFLMPFAHELQ